MSNFLFITSTRPKLSIIWHAAFYVEQREIENKLVAYFTVVSLNLVLIFVQNVLVIEQIVICQVCY